MNKYVGLQERAGNAASGTTTVGAAAASARCVGGGYITLTQRDIHILTWLNNSGDGTQF